MFNKTTLGSALPTLGFSLSLALAGCGGVTSKPVTAKDLQPTLLTAPVTSPTGDLDYAGKRLTNVNFLHHELRGADFRGATLEGVVFDHADLTAARFAGATFKSSELGPTSFISADLTSADFTKAHFQSTVRFQYANITATAFRNIDTTNTVFGSQLHFDGLEAPPSFSGATMTCEFPWFWGHLDVEEATLPTCANASLEPPPHVPVSPTSPNQLEGPAPVLLKKAKLSAVRSSPNHTIDSIVSGNKIFVAKSGTDSADCGNSPDEPCDSISLGITRCAASKPCTVLVAEGSYQLSKTIELEDQVSLIGGYADFNSPPQTQTMVLAPPGGAPVMRADGVTASIQQFILVGSPPKAGKATVVLHLKDTPFGFKLANVRINGGNITTIPKPAKKGSVGKDGGDGQSAWAGGDAGIADGGTSSCGATGGRGGRWRWNVAVTVANSPGHCYWTCRTSGPYPIHGEKGSADGPYVLGGKGSQSSGKACSFDKIGVATPTGGRGLDGRDATRQAAGGIGWLGKFESDGTWKAVASKSGTPGLSGGGGGGGGSGQAMVTTVNSDCDYTINSGSGGGGGGAGGCGGTGGRGGMMGSANFAVVLADAMVTIGENVVIVAGPGGTGGQGGAGAGGGKGGLGGEGCQGPIQCFQAAASGGGGDGGKGGASGGGAGGAGGPSLVYLLFNSDISKSSIYHGQAKLYLAAPSQPGAGGLGAGDAPAGAPGTPGPSGVYGGGYPSKN